MVPETADGYAIANRRRKGAPPPKPEEPFDIRRRNGLHTYRTESTGSLWSKMRKLQNKQTVRIVAMTTVNLPDRTAEVGDEIRLDELPGGLHDLRWLENHYYVSSISPEELQQRQAKAQQEAQPK